MASPWTGRFVSALANSQASGVEIRVLVGELHPIIQDVRFGIVILVAFDLL
jgi:hypothetical protein